MWTDNKCIMCCLWHRLLCWNANSNNNIHNTTSTQAYVFPTGYIWCTAVQWSQESCNVHKHVCFIRSRSNWSDNLDRQPMMQYSHKSTYCLWAPFGSLLRLRFVTLEWARNIRTNVRAAYAMQFLRAFCLHESVASDRTMHSVMVVRLSVWHTCNRRFSHSTWMRHPCTWVMGTWWNIEIFNADRINQKFVTLAKTSLKI